MKNVQNFKQSGLQLKLRVQKEKQKRWKKREKFFLPIMKLTVVQPEKLPALFARATMYKSKKEHLDLNITHVRIAMSMDF